MTMTYVKALGGNEKNHENCHCGRLRCRDFNSTIL